MHGYGRKRCQGSQKKEQRTESGKFSYRPKISIVIPLYNTPIPYLRKIIDSVVEQTYDNWQLCLADEVLLQK
ncbi:MAG: glycosyltransferase [Mediterraneibacter faecis]